MGIFDKFKKKEQPSDRMSYHDAPESYVTEINNILFESEEEQNERQIHHLTKIAEHYYDAFDRIVEFMMPDLKLVYGVLDKELVKEKLGKPTIDYDNGTVKYLEQSFDDIHIFVFEFLDDEFQDIQYFSIDG